MGVVINRDDLLSLFMVAVVVSIGILGVVQWLKNLRLFRDRKGRLPFVTGVLALAMGYLNSPLGLGRFDGWVQVADTAMLVLAVTQLCWDMLAKALPRMVNGVIDRLFSLKGEGQADD